MTTNTTQRRYIVPTWLLAMISIIAFLALVLMPAPAHADEIPPADVPPVLVDEPAPDVVPDPEPIVDEAPAEDVAVEPAPAARVAAPAPAPLVAVAPAASPLTCPALTAITDLAQLDQSSNSVDGSLLVNQLEAGGLHIATDVAGHRKAAGYVLGVGWQPLDTVTDFVLAWTGTAAQPGGQLVVDLDGDGTPDGTLVIEPINGGVQWLSVPAGGTWIPRLDSPHTAGGGGYPNQGTFAEWIALNPDAQWTLPGYSLGSGITGDGLIASLTVQGSTDCVYTFGLPAVVVPPVVTPPASLPTVPVLAVTGTDVDPLALAGGITLLLGGLAAVAWTRRVDLRRVALALRHRV